MIREAFKEDIVGLLEVYRPYIEETSISFETTVPSLKEFENRFDSITSKYPWLICEIDGELAGYAYGCAHRHRAGYHWSVECAVYVSNKFHRRGVGKKLYSELFKKLKEMGFANVFAGITLPNEASVKLHEKLGFESIGTFKNIGYKFEKWWDVGWWQLNLQLPKKPKNI